MTDTTAADLTEREADANALDGYRTSHAQQNTHYEADLNAAHARLEQAEARIDQLLATLDDERAFHKLRSAAVNRTGADNDRLRAKIARVEKQAAAMEDLAALSLTDPTDLLLAARSIRAALADQEPK